MLLAEEAQLSACLSSAMIRASQNPRRAPVGILRTMAGRRCHRGGGSRRAAVGLEAVIEAALWVGQKVRRLQNGGGLAAVACGKQSSAVSSTTPAPCLRFAKMRSTPGLMKAKIGWDCVATLTQATICFGKSREEDFF